MDLTPAELARICREHTLALVATERAYFESRSPLKEALDFLRTLEDQIRHAPEETLFLRLGYGIGWCGTTGELASSRERLEILRLFENRNRKIGRLSASAYDESFNTFPKTRRYVVRANEPLFGWIRLDPDDDCRVPRVLSAPVCLPRREVLPQREAAAQQEGQAPSQAMGVVARILALRHNEVKGRFDVLLREVEVLEDPNERAQAMQALADLVRRSVPRRDRDFYRREEVTRLLNRNPERAPTS